MANRYLRALTACSLLLVMVGVQASTIVGSKHDLSDGGVELCVHCHMPNATQSNTPPPPIWANSIKLDKFATYASPPNEEACTARPGGVSMVCMSCHDGTSGRAVYSDPQQRVVGAVDAGKGSKGDECLKCHSEMPGSNKPKPELSMAHKWMIHPVSRAYPAGERGYLSLPDNTKGWPDVRLFEGRVECPSCHNVHDPTVAPFLRISNAGSAICVRCHEK
jgi:predicted CXXCH cytochrome family protein